MTRADLATLREEVFGLDSFYVTGKSVGASLLLAASLLSACLVLSSHSCVCVGGVGEGGVERV